MSTAAPHYLCRIGFENQAVHLEALQELAVCISGERSVHSE